MFIIYIYSYSWVKAGMLFVYKMADMHSKDTVTKRMARSESCCGSQPKKWEFILHFAYCTVRAINFLKIQIYQLKKRRIYKRKSFGIRLHLPVSLLFLMRHIMRVIRQKIHTLAHPHFHLLVSEMPATSGCHSPLILTAVIIKKSK